MAARAVVAMAVSWDCALATAACAALSRCLSAAACCLASFSCFCLAVAAARSFAAGSLEPAANATPGDKASIVAAMHPARARRRHAFADTGAPGEETNTPSGDRKSQDRRVPPCRVVQAIDAIRPQTARTDYDH